MRKYAHAPEYVEKEDDYWTVNWFARLASGVPAAAGTRIGGNTLRGTPRKGY